MRKLLKSWSLRNKFKRILFSWFLAILLSHTAASQIANYVNNGSFEDLYSCNSFSQAIKNAVYWRSVDSICFGGGLCSSCPGMGTAPLNPFTYQKPRTGATYFLATFFCSTCTTTISSRGNLRNRLKSTLQAGKTYCVKFYVNITNTSTYGSDGFGVYFGNNNLDTIASCDIPLTYLNPQVQNPINNIITDTLNWVPITGTFVASGSEKHMIISNFKSNAATNSILINPANLPDVFTDVCIDDVSCIDIDLPAYAGPDLYCIPGNSVYLGRPRDVGIDEACMWYQLPDLTTAIDTAAGIAVSPAVTTTYAVRQEICAGIRWDTVVVYASGVGVEDKGLIINDLRLYPVPVANELQVALNSGSAGNYSQACKVVNSLGQIVREEELSFRDGVAHLNMAELPEGVYSLHLKSDSSVAVRKRFVISR